MQQKNIFDEHLFLFQQNKNGNKGGNPAENSKLQMCMPWIYIYQLNHNKVHKLIPFSQLMSNALS